MRFGAPFVAGFFLYSAITFAGPITSGGGKGVVCEWPNGRTVQPLDLYEAETLRGLPISPSGTFVEELGKLERQLNFVYGGNSSTSLLEELLSWQDRFTRLVRPVRPNEKMPETNDLGIMPTLPTNCRLAQIAIYMDDSANGGEGEVIIEPTLFPLLSPKDRLALYYHEAIYRAWREDFPFTGSSFVRQLVGYAFSTEQLQPLKASLKKGATVPFCRSDKVGFWVLPDRLVFEEIGFGVQTQTEFPTNRDVTDELRRNILLSPLEGALVSRLWHGSSIGFMNGPRGIEIRLILPGLRELKVGDGLRCYDEKI